MLDVDPFFFVEGAKRGLLKVRMAFELVGGGNDGGGGEEALEFGEGEVGDADGFGFAGLEGFFHGFVGLVDIYQECLCMGREKIKYVHPHNRHLLVWVSHHHLSVSERHRF